MRGSWIGSCRALKPSPAAKPASAGSVSNSGGGPMNWAMKSAGPWMVVGAGMLSRGQFRGFRLRIAAPGRAAHEPDGLPLRPLQPHGRQPREDEREIVEHAFADV